MTENPLNILRKLDPDLLKLVDGAGSLALADDALPRRIKLLIAMSLDASNGSAGGVMALARQAMQAGATRQEVLEA